MVDPRLTLFEMATSMVFSLVHSEVQSGLVRRRLQGTADTAKPPPSPDEKDCPVCAVHSQTAEAYMLLDGLAERCQREGRIPPGLGGTIPLARGLLDGAGRGAAALAVSDVRLRNDAVTFQGHVAALSGDLQGDLTPDQVPALAQRGRKAWQLSYALAETAFRQDKSDTAAQAVAEDPLYQWMRRVREEDMDADSAVTELKAILNKEPAHA